MKNIPGWSRACPERPEGSRMGLQACINATLTFLSSRAKREEADATESESRDLAVINPVLWNSLRRGTALAVPYSSEKERARLAASRASGKRSVKRRQK